MMKKLLFAVFVSFYAIHSMAQIKDVTFTVSPVVEYTWWDSNTTLTNTPLWGIRAGFGLGPVFELRGFYEQSFDVKSALRPIDWQTVADWADKMQESNLKIIRKGGEIKFNFIPTGFFSPYLTAGGGVQTIKYKIGEELLSLSEDQLFAAIGLGTKFNLSRRIVFSLEGRGTFFNANKGSSYLKPTVVFDDRENKLMKNWSALASLDFYFGGVNDKHASKVSTAYNQMFADGFRGMKFVVEPGMAYFKGNKKSNLSNQYFVGATAGLDFSSLVGVRGFYYRATDNPDKLSLKLNKDLSMYGGYFLFRLNQPRGVTPYLTLGAGYLDVDKTFATKIGNDELKSTVFASTGLGLEIPLSKYFALYGTYNLMFTPGKKDKNEVLAIQNPSQVKVNSMLNAGLRINFGAAAKANDIYKRNIDTALLLEREKNTVDNNTKIDELRAEYQTRIDKLTKDLDKANQNNDINKASEILEEKKQTEKILDKIEQNAVTVKVETETAAKSKLIRIDSEDFDALVNRVLNEIKKTNSTTNETNSRLKLTPLEVRLMQELNLKNPSNNQKLTTDHAETASNENKIIQELSKISQKLDHNLTQLELKNNNQADTIIISDEEEEKPEELTELSNSKKSTVSDSKQVVVVGQNSVAETRTGNGVEIKHKKHAFLAMNRLSVLTGLGYNNSFSWNSGVRAHLQIANSGFDLMPELYATIGKNNGVGVAANLVYNFGHSFKSPVNPYLGVGCGIMPLTKKFAPRVILGTFLKVGKGNLFVDYSCNNLFKQNQIACGYQFAF